MGGAPSSAPTGAVPAERTTIRATSGAFMKPTLGHLKPARQAETEAEIRRYLSTLLLAPLVVPLAVDVMAQALLVVVDVLPLAMRHLAVLEGPLALVLDGLLLVLEPLRFLRRERALLDAAVDSVLLLLLTLLDALGVPDRHDGK